MESGLTHINAEAANKVHPAPGMKSTRREQYCSLFASLSVVASAVGSWMMRCRPGVLANLQHPHSPMQISINPVRLRSS
jgi:hypothetical protein